VTRLSDKADQEFFEQARKLSPKFPDVATQLERRRCQREAIVARVFLAMMFASLVLAIFTDDTVWNLIDAAVFLVGFIITCFVSGNRQYKRSRRA
jgi:membrane protein YdbS with pleckstrin-like domain